MRGDVTRNRNVQSGKPVLAGTRMPTEAILAFWQQRMSVAEIQEQYPHLTEEQIYTAVDYELTWWRKLERWWNDRPWKVCGCD